MLFIRGAVALGSSLIIVRRLLPSTASSFVLAIESFRPQHVRSAWSRHVDCFRLLAFGIVHVEFHLFALSLWVNNEGGIVSHTVITKKKLRKERKKSSSLRGVSLFTRAESSRRETKKRGLQEKGCARNFFFSPYSESKKGNRTSRKLRNPSAFKCDWWTKISSLPSSGMINPNPLLALNHLTA